MLNRRYQFRKTGLECGLSLAVLYLKLVASGSLSMQFDELKQQSLFASAGCSHSGSGFGHMP